MISHFDFFKRPTLSRKLFGLILPTPKPFLSLSPDSLEIGYPLALGRKQLPWNGVDLLFVVEKKGSRSIFVEFLKGHEPEFILEEIDDHRSSLEINRELSRLGYFRSAATPEELEAARRDDLQKGS